MVVVVLMRDKHGEVVAMRILQDKPKYWEKICPSVTLFTTNPT
jgi:chloramphenicol O-acetyltransferase